MPCYKPLKGWKSKEAGPNGKRPVVFVINKGYSDLPVEVPCGQCIGCRLERSRQWAIRCTHEASLHPENCFITLTYDDQHLPEDLSVNVRDWQLFMKRLRKRFGPRIRFFHCGEYGEKFGRPHYHACLFNFDFPDKQFWKTTNDNPLFTSKILNELWPFGFSSIGTVTFESAAYVARYVMKKITGDAAEDHYEWVHPSTGEIFTRRPEYTTMSRRPGIGSRWLDNYRTDVYPHDYVVLRGVKMRPPKFYDRQFEISHSETYRTVRMHRKWSGKEHADDNTPARLKVRETVQEARLQRLPRNLD